MSLGFLLPAAFAALAALALPLLLHLARRSEQRPTDFAALRWLRERPKPRHRVRFDELPLLALRLLLIALLALWLARPVLFGGGERGSWVAVMPGVDAAQVKDAGAEVRWLAVGFPKIDQPAPPPSPSFASLLRQLDAEMPRGAKLSAVVPAQLQGADAERPRLSRPVEWRVVPGAMPALRPAIPKPPSLTVRYTPGRESGLRYLRAAAVAWRSRDFSAAPVSEPVPANARNLVWLADGPVPEAVRDWIKSGGTALLGSKATIKATGEGAAYWRDDLGAPLVEGRALGRGRILRFTRPLLPSAMPQLLEPDFPRRLGALFGPPAPPPARVYARDYAPLIGGLASVQSGQDLQGWLALLIAALFVAERWLATRPTRAAAP